MAVSAMSPAGSNPIGGAKLTIDGSPQGFTALRDRPYYDPVGDYPPGYAGYAAITMEQTQDAVNWCYENDIQIIVHANKYLHRISHVASTQEGTKRR